MRRALAIAVTAAVLLSGCGSRVEQVSAAQVVDPPATSPTTTTSSAPSPTPSPAAPAKQEPTAYGTKTVIANWSAFASDPAAQFFREWNALMAAAVNEGRFPPELTAIMDPALMERITPVFRDAWAKGWTTDPQIRARILSIKSKGNSVIVESCMPNSSLSLKKPDGTFVTASDEFGSSINLHTFVRSETGAGFVVKALADLAGAC